MPFPHNVYGEYVGYKTDHDPNDRGTSVGPYTSRYMTEKLEQAVREKKIEILDHHQVIRILSDGEKIVWDPVHELKNGAHLLIRCTNLVYATGAYRRLMDRVCIRSANMVRAVWHLRLV